MAMNIKNQAVEQAARELADRTGESLTQAISVAITERLARLDAAPAAGMQARLLALSESFGSRYSHLSPAERSSDFLYDDDGLPT